MKRFIFALPLFLVLSLSSMLIFAADFNAEITGEEVTMTYTEPTTNSDGSPLKDLDHTTGYYNIGQGRVVGGMMPATSPTGGGDVTNVFVIPIMDCPETNAELFATATDDAENPNESVDTPHIIKNIDRCAPSGMN